MIAARMVCCLCCPCRILHYAGIWPFSTHVDAADAFLHNFGGIFVFEQAYKLYYVCGYRMRDYREAITHGIVKKLARILFCTRDTV